MAGKEYTWKQRPGTYPWLAQQKKDPILGRPISVRENYIRVATGQKPVWMPAYGFESNTCWPDVIEEHPVPEEDGKDWWGVEWIMQEDIGGMMVKPFTRTLSEFSKWKEELKWPDLDSVDFASDGEKISSRFDPDRPHIYQCVEGIFERLHELIPFDETLEAMVEEPELVAEFFDRMADYKIKLCSKVFENYGRIDGVLYHDDWGYQRCGFFSNQMFEELLVPPTKKVMQFLKSQGKFIELHSCGKNIQYVPYMIDMGIDMWNPQRDINDPPMLKEKYGDKMTFVFPIKGLDAPHMEESDIRRLVREFVDFYGKGGRIMASIMVPKDMQERAVIARDELYNYSLEYYKNHD